MHEYASICQLARTNYCQIKSFDFFEEININIKTYTQARKLAETFSGAWKFVYKKMKLKNTIILGRLTSKFGGFEAGNFKFEWKKWPTKRYI